MNRSIVCPLGLVLSCLLLLFSGSLFAKDDPNEIPDEIVINNEGYKQDRKGPVTFSHLAHAQDYEVACTECHHDYEEGKNIWQEGDDVYKCSECHDAVTSDGKVKKLLIAYHSNCIGCHKKLVAEGISEEAPYKKCYQCHEKKSR